MLHQIVELAIIFLFFFLAINISLIDPRGHHFKTFVSTLGSIVIIYDSQNNIRRDTLQLGRLEGQIAIF